MREKQAVRLVTFNLHKGRSAFNRHDRLTEMATALSRLQADLIFLQEVQGRASHQHAMRTLPQHHYLADALVLDARYGLNARYDHGHHGNAILSRFSLQTVANRDISLNAIEQRGILHVEVLPQGWPQAVACLCVHLNLLARDRRRQYRILLDYIAEHIPVEQALVLAGDFNDWRMEACLHLQQAAGLHEVHHTLHGHYAATFPARLPLLCLDRVYVRGLYASHARSCRGQPWSHLSDHLPIITELLPSDGVSPEPASQAVASAIAP